MSLKLHSQAVYRKCCAGMYAIRRLITFNVPLYAVWNAYLAFVFSHVAYAWPAVCDIPLSERAKFSRLEKQAIQLCNRVIVGGGDSLTTRLEYICIRLIKKVASFPSHPLRELFSIRGDTRHFLRRRQVLNNIFPKSSRVTKSFMGFTGHT